jgi:hypothetical protein
VSQPPAVSISRAGVRRAVRALRWRARKARAELALRLAPDTFAPQLAAARIPVDAEVAVYFADGPDRVYQLDQWIPVLERLARSHRVVLILRELRTMKDVQDRTSLPTVCVTTFLDLMNLYDSGEFKVGIYVNNGQRNFQSLNNPRMLHVHVNHGESDKLSSFSNQVKAYDRVFVAGPVAVERYREALIAFDDTKVVAVGRPQLDLEFGDSAAGLPASTRRTVMYAPTWEGESESNNWTSMDRFGVSIVTQLLDLPDVRVIYKPHPRIPTSVNPGVARAHKRITSLIRTAAERDPDSGHQSRLDGNILAMFGACDALVGDVSSVTLDFLYLRPEAPIFLTDRRDDRELLAADSPLTEGADIVDSGTIASLGSAMTDALTNDKKREDRVRTRSHYFGDLTPGDSSRRFEEAVAALIAERDRLLTGHRRVTTGDVDDHTSGDNDDTDD